MTDPAYASLTKEQKEFLYGLMASGKATLDDVISKHGL